MLIKMLAIDLSFLSILIDLTGVVAVNVVKGIENILL